MIQKAERRDPRADHAGGDEVDPLGDLVPAVDEDGQEAGFEEEREDGLGRQRCAEDVAHVLGVVGPVGPELELHDDSRGHADGEVDREQLDPEAHHAVVERIVPGEPHPAQNHEHACQTDGERREDVMEAHGQPELDPRQHQRIHAHLPVLAKPALFPECLMECPPLFIAIPPSARLADRRVQRGREPLNPMDSCRRGW